MDPDAGKEFANSAIFKTTVLTVAFSSVYFHKTSNHTSVFKPPADHKDSVAVVVTETKPAVAKKKKKTIYLTFDDGPNKGTRNVQRIVDQEEVPVTLFVIGEHIYGSRAQGMMYDSICISPYIEIANHSFTHARGKGYQRFYDNADSVVSDFRRCADSLNVQHRISRTPGRNIWRTDSLRYTDIRSSEAAADSLYNNGFIVIGWDAEWHFNKDQLAQSPEHVLTLIDSLLTHNRTRTADHLVLLAHDQAFEKTADSASLHRFIADIKKNDEYQLEMVGKYPGLPDWANKVSPEVTP